MTSDKNQTAKPDGHIDVEFFTPSDVGPRNWGREILVAHAPGKFTGKMIIMNPGAAGGLQRHHLKDEYSYIFSGEAWVDYDNGDGKLQRRKAIAGETIHFPTGSVHRVTAITECTMFEVSTPHFNDRVRMEEQYDEQIPEGGLPSTTIDEVETR